MSEREKLLGPEENPESNSGISPASSGSQFPTSTAYAGKEVAGRVLKAPFPWFRRQIPRGAHRVG